MWVPFFPVSADIGINFLFAFYFPSDGTWAFLFCPLTEVRRGLSGFAKNCRLMSRVYQHWQWTWSESMWPCKHRKSQAFVPTNIGWNVSYKFHVEIIFLRSINFSQIEWGSSQFFPLWVSIEDVMYIICYPYVPKRWNWINTWPRSIPRMPLRRPAAVKRPQRLLPSQQSAVVPKLDGKQLTRMAIFIWLSSHWLHIEREEERKLWTGWGLNVKRFPAPRTWQNIFSSTQTYSAGRSKKGLR